MIKGWAASKPNDKETTVVWMAKRMSSLIRPVAPFRLDLTVWTLRRRPDNVMDRWDGAVYRRVLVVGGEPVEVAVTQIGLPESPQLRVVLTGPGVKAGAKSAVIATLKRVLGLEIDLSDFYQFAAKQPRLGPLGERFRGVKPPRLPSLFETLVNAIACQQVTLTQGIRLLNRLTEAHGLAVGDDPGSPHAFPQPETIARLDVEALRPLGLSRQKARAMIESAHAFSAGQLDLDWLANATDEAAVERLQELRGVGRWTAEYMLLRGLGRWHVFPGDDVGARNNLVRWLKLTDDLDYAGVQRVLARWKRYGGLIYFHLLLDRLAEAGYVQ